jgi:hypothetical protein
MDFFNSINDYIMGAMKSATPKPTTVSRSKQAKAVKTSRNKRQVAKAGDRSYPGYKGRVAGGSTASAPYNAPKPKAAGAARKGYKGALPSADKAGPDMRNRAAPVSKKDSPNPPPKRVQTSKSLSAVASNPSRPLYEVMPTATYDLPLKKDSPSPRKPGPKAGAKPKKKATKFSRGNARGTRTFRSGGDI